ncbi:hypothetical protein GW17_00056397 [Ensete ventricosum]|nr:hypothetical protein GW17_00056397 [Ensete ventricosum]RZR86355.1 hypothetical protein BHM03_00013540 [Ensete ventricosum]
MLVLMGLVGYRDYRRMDDQDRYDSVGMDDSMEDERDLDQIMADRRAAEMELDAREGRTGGIHDRKLPQMLYDQDASSELVETSPANKCSLEIDYKQFIYTEANIAIWLADAPQSVLEVMEEVAKNVVFDMHKNYKNIHQKIFVRITNLPVYDQIRNIR